MTKTAELYRMVMDDHICPYGLRSRDLLQRQGYEIVDHRLESREETEAFKKEHGVETTPQTFINGERIGGLDDLQEYFGVAPDDKDETTYVPVIAIFAATALMALSLSWAAFGQFLTIRMAEWFIALSMCVLGIQKLRDLTGFQNNFITYDLVGMRNTRYSHVYAFAETGAGVLMLGHLLTWLAAPVAIFISAINGVSVFKAVYIDERDLKCACVGGDSNVPLGFVSLTENILMFAMGWWMLIRWIG